MTAAAGGGGLHAAAAEDGVVLSVSTQGCSAAPFFRAAQVEHCLTGLPFFDVITLDGGGGAAGADGSGGGGPRGLIPGTIVELYGPSGSGKSEIALNALAAWVLPARLGGVGGTALVLDLDFTFAAARLHQLLRARVQAAAATAGGNVETDTAVEAALRRVALAHCGDELEAFAAVEVLKYDLNHPVPPAHSSSGNGSSGDTAPVGPVLVLLDGLGALHHERRAAEGCKQPESCFDYMLARALGRLAAARAVSVLACKPALVGGKRVAFAAAAADAGGGGGMVLVEERRRSGGGGDSFPSVEHREYLPPQWAKLVTHRLALLRDAPGETPYFTARLVSLVPGGLAGAGSGKDGACGAYWFRVEDGGVYVLPPSPEEGEEEGGGGGW